MEKIGLPKVLLVIHICFSVAAKRSEEDDLKTTENKKHLTDVHDSLQVVLERW